MFRQIGQLILLAALLVFLTALGIAGLITVLWLVGLI